MEFIAQLFRALANRARIRILRLLTVIGEMSVTQIGEATGVEASLISGHLRVLASAGLVWRRRSGRIVRYRLAEKAGNPVTAAVLRMLPHAFGWVDSKKPATVAAADRAGHDTDSDAALFACFTAFTHPRRLQIIRHLARHGTTPSTELGASLSMSMPACMRHLAKLHRRGFLRRKSVARRGHYALAGGQGRVQRTVLRAVRQHVVASTDLTPGQV